jgi:hypothetical protein
MLFMRTKYIFILIILMVGFSSCIELYNPDLGSSSIVKYVVDGQITDQEGYQKVSISISSTFENPDFTPLSYCQVKIIDNLGNSFDLEETGWGNYRVWMGQEYLKAGNSYQVNITTPSGIVIVSDYDQMPECADVDSIYYSRKDIPTTNPSITYQGIQFNVDVDKKNTNSNYYRWEVEETWEHHAIDPIIYYLTRLGVQKAEPPDYSRFICWTTRKLTDVYTLTTENFTGVKYTMKPLNIIDNTTQRLNFGYSLLVYQYAISEPAFSYWDKLRINSTQQGGLYNTQPLRIKGNLRSTTNPDLDVLGFFSATSVKTKRIFAHDIPNFVKFIPSCIPPHLPEPREGYKYMVEINGVMYVQDPGCVECDILSGTTVKPNFWPY